MVSWVAEEPSDHAWKTSAEEHSHLDLPWREAVEVVLGFVCVADAPLPLECLIRAEVESKSWSVSNEHALVPSGETFESFCTVNASYFLAITHVLSLAVLSSYFQQVKYKGDVCVCAIGYQSTKPNRSLTYNPANTPDRKSFCHKLRLSRSLRYRLDHDLDVNSLYNFN